MIEKFKNGLIRQSDLLGWLKNEIEELSKAGISIAAQVRILNEKYDIDLKEPSYRSWLKRNKNKFFGQSDFSEKSKQKEDPKPEEKEEEEKSKKSPSIMGDFFKNAKE